MCSPTSRRPVLQLGLFRQLAVWFLAAVFASAAYATITPGNLALQMQTGNPSGATADAANHSHYLIQRPQYALDYNDTTHEPNWVAWDLTSDDLGSSGRSNFIVDTTLPGGFYQVLTTDYSGSGYDRGHMCPSADRTVTVADNQQLFYMSNMVPQSPDNNQGVWANFESYCRSLASAGNEILIISGPSLFGGSTIASGVAIPGYTWKIAVVVPPGSGTAASRITASTRVIAIKVPNIAGVRNTPWQNFVKSVAQIEIDTGFHFFTDPAIPTSVANALKTVVDGQSVTGAPAIVSQSGSQTTVVGGTATFSVTASGDAPLTYQWSHDDTEIPGATDATLTLNNVQGADVGNYSVVVTNAVGSATSSPTALIVTGLPPSIMTSPSPQTVSAGSGVTFIVTAGGSPTLTYQWRKGGVAIAGNASATTAALTLTNLQLADAASYDVVVTNSIGSATSTTALLTVNPAAPSITGQPAAASASTGSNASFTVTAVGTASLSYQWRKNGSPLANGGVVSGATTPTLLLSGVSAVDAANYDVIVTNGLGSATSTAVSLTVNPPPASNVTWNFTTADPSSGLTTDLTGGTVTQNNSTASTTTGLPPLLSSSSPSGSYTGASAGNNGGAAARIGALNQASGGSAYFEFTLSPISGKRLLASGISFGMRSTSTGPQAFAVYTSVDNFATAVASGAVPANGNWAFYTPAFTTVTGATSAPVTFRIYGYSGAGSAVNGTVNWRIDDLKLTVTTVFPPPVPPVVSATTPTNGTTSFDVTSPITVTFNEAVSFTGTWFTITSAANGPTAATVNGGPTTFTLTPPSFFAYNDTINVSINTAQVVDQSTGTIHGTTTNNFTFTTASFVPPTPPSVTTQPVAQSVNVGSNATFTVVASGTAPLTYQWRKGGLNIAGNSSATTASLTLTSVTLADAGSFDCVVSNVAGSDVSHTAALTVTVVPPTITTQPIAQAVGVGGNASFTVVASGTAPFAYQWRKGGVPITGNASALTPTLALTGVTDTDTGSYDVVVSNTAGSATSASTALAVIEGSPSAIYWDFATAAPTSGVPAGVTGGTVTPGNNNGTTTLLTTTSAPGGSNGTYPGASAGNNAGAAARIGVLNQGASGSAYFEFTFTPPAGRQFAATALAFGTRSTGTGPQAFALFSSLDGYTTPIATGPITNDSTWRLLTPAFTGVTTAAGGPITFRLFGYNGAGSPASGTANWRIDDVKLTAGLIALPPAPPTITTQPVAQTATVGDTVSFTVAATGTAPFTFQWRKGGTPIAGNASATTATLALGPITTADAAFYDCVVTNSVGSATSNAVGLTVNKAVATLTLDPLAFTYDGAAHAATATTAPATLAVVFTYNGLATVPINAGTYAVVATIVDENYTGSATGSLTIAPAVATVALGGLNTIYNAMPQAATATTAPAGLPLAFTYDSSAAAPTNAGGYTVVATVTDPNYTGSATGTLTIAKAGANVLLSDLGQVYNTAAHMATVTTAPVGLAVAVTYDGNSAAPMNAGNYAVVATVNDANYFGSAAGTLAIAKANAPIVLGGLSAVYDTSPHAATATTTPAGLTVALTYNGSGTAPTNAGSYPVAASVVDANYTGSAAGTLVIDKANAPVALAGLTTTYDGTARVVTATTTPNGLNVAITYDGSATAPTNAGSYAILATVNEANYLGSATGTLTVGQAAATVTLSNLSQTYSGTPKSATIVTTPVNLTASVTYAGNAAAPTNAGSYPVVVTIADPNYSGSGTGTLVIAKAAATVTLNGLNAIYDGSAKSASATTTPAGLTTTFTYDGGTSAPISAGSYNVIGSVSDNNYTGSANGVFVIAKATAAVALGGLHQTYDGTAKSVSVTTTPAGLNTTVTYNGSTTAPTAANSYAVVVTVNNANYSGTASGTLVIDAATGAIALSNLTQVYDGTPKSVTATTTPAGLATSITYAGSAAAPTNPGSYAIVATITDPNYSATASGTLVITSTALVRHAPSLDGGLDGSLQVLAGENLTLNGNAWVSGDILVPGTPTVRLNGHPTFAGTQDGTGSATPSDYEVTLNGNAVLRHLVRRTDPIAMPVVAAPAAPTGTRSVSLNSASDSAGDFTTIRNLTLNGNAGTRAVPAGTYGAITVNGNSGLVLGVAGATTPAVYQLQSLTVNGNATIQIAGPVVITLANGVTLNSDVGAAAHPEWLALNVASGGVTLNGNVTFTGAIIAPNGTVVINGNSALHGSVVADRLTINGNSVLKQP